MGYLTDQYGRMLSLGSLGEDAVGAVLPLAVADGTPFMLPGGGKLLERRELHPLEGPWYPCGFVPNTIDIAGTPTAVAEIVSHAGYAHEADQSYHYRVRNVYGNGFMDDEPPGPVRLDFDDVGALISEGKPHRPIAVQPTPIEGGKFAITFVVTGQMPGASPVRFEAYAGVSGAAVNFSSPLVETGAGGSLTYLRHDGRLGPKRFVTEGYAHGTSVRFAMRACGAIAGAALMELNEYLSSTVVAEDSGPAGFSAVAQAGQPTGSHR